MFSSRRATRALAGPTIGLLALLVAACGTDGDTNGTGAGPIDDDGNDAAAEPIPIGLLAPTSGPVAVLGEEMPRGAELAVEYVNERASGSVPPLELVVADTQADPQTAVAAVRELSDQGIDIFFGTISSSEALAVMDEVERLGAVFIAAAPHAMEITHEQFSEHTFRVTDNAYMRQLGQAKLIAEDYGDANDWAIVVPNNALGVSSADSFKAGLRDFGDDDVNVVAEIHADFGASDYRNVLTQVLNANPDGVFSAMYGGDAVTMYQQGIGMGFFDEIDIFLDNANEWQVARALSSDMPSVVQSFHWAPQAYDNDVSNFLETEYEARHGELPSGFSSEVFAAVMAISAALEQTEGSTDVDGLIAALKDLTFDSPSGPRTFRAEDHQVVKDVVFGRIDPAPDSPEGWEVTDVATVPGDDLLPPPSPGEALEFGELPW